MSPISTWKVLKVPKRAERRGSCQECVILAGPSSSMIEKHGCEMTRNQRRRHAVQATSTSQQSLNMLAPVTMVVLTGQLQTAVDHVAGDCV